MWESEPGRFTAHVATARWYDANLGQWLSEDPLGFRAGDENVRRYVGNRSTISTDPMGLEDPDTIKIDNKILVLMSGYGEFRGVPNASNGPVKAAAEQMKKLGMAHHVRLEMPVDWETYQHDMKQENKNRSEKNVPLPTRKHICFSG